MLRKMLVLLVVLTTLLVACSEGSEVPLDIEISIEEAAEKAPFALKQPNVPFEVTKKSAKILDMEKNYKAVEMTYENTEQRESLNLVLMVNNAKEIKNVDGIKGAVLENGYQTWEQGDENVSAMFWRDGELNYILLSWKGDSRTIKPLYDYSELVEIANTVR